MVWGGCETRGLRKAIVFAFGYVGLVRVCLTEFLDVLDGGRRRFLLGLRRLGRDGC